VAERRQRRLPDLGTGLFAVGLAEAASNLAGDSLIDRAGDVAVATTPLPVIEETIKRLGTTDKPFLRANLMAGGALAIGLLGSRRGSLSRQVLLAGAGLLAAGLGRRALDAREAAAVRDFELPVPTPLERVGDGADDWPGAEPFDTEPGRFYATDINLRAPAVELDSWRLEVRSPGTEARLSIDELTALGLHERDAALVCVHNRPGWDRLGQQRWTGVPIENVLSAAGALPEDPAGFDLVTEAVDGYSQIIPLAEALARRSWVVVGMAGRPLPREHGYPARVMTPGLVGQYNGVKWLHRLAVTPSGSERAWWVRRGWPDELIEVPPMARIDSPANTGMPPRLPPPPVGVPGGRVDVVGTAWAPPHGVEAVELRVDGGAWVEAELAAEVNGDSWRRWRARPELDPGSHTLEARCRSRSGALQEGSPSEPFPYGCGAFHTVELTAR